MSLTQEKMTALYTCMLKIRLFEEKVAELFAAGKIPGFVHLYIGEEAVATGVCASLHDQDYITSTHRGHGHLIAKGGDLKLMMAELFGKKTGYCKGKGGSMHIADVDLGIMGANGIVGGGPPLAAGAALAAQYRGTDHVAVCFFGDGAINEGSFHESVNLASIWKLPVLFVCENNQYAMSMSSKRSVNIKDLAVRASSYGIPGKTIDGNDFLEVYSAVKEAKEYVKKTGPMLLVSNTYRFKGHSKSDANKYRSKEEIEEWKGLDPLPRFRAWLEKEKILSAHDLDSIERQAFDEIEAAVEFASQSPDPSIDTILEDVYAD